MLKNQGYWDDLCEQCKECGNLHVLSARMDGNCYYHCGKYPLKDSDEICPKYMQAEKDIKKNMEEYCEA